jgi:hypothetical protein
LGDFVVIEAKSGLEDGTGALEGGAGIRQFIKVVQHVSEVGEVAGNIWVVGPEPLRQDL